LYDVTPLSSDVDSILYDVSPSSSDVDSNLYDVTPSSSDVDPILYDVSPSSSDVDSILYDVTPLSSNVDSILYDVTPLSSDVDSLSSDQTPLWDDVDPISRNGTSNNGFKDLKLELQDSNSAKRDWARSCWNPVLVLKVSIFLNKYHSGILFIAIPPLINRLSSLSGIPINLAIIILLCSKFPLILFVVIPCRILQAMNLFHLYDRF
jgi:hypothetical protein